MARLREMDRRRHHVGRATARLGREGRDDRETVAVELSSKEPAETPDEARMNSSLAVGLGPDEVALIARLVRRVKVQLPTEDDPRSLRPSPSDELSPLHISARSARTIRRQKPVRRSRMRSCVRMRLRLTTSDEWLVLATEDETKPLLNRSDVRLLVG
jgi:hypothetical protein